MILFIFLLSVLSCNTSQMESKSETWDTVRPLRGIYANNFLLGNIISPGDLDIAKKVRFDILKRHYNTVTAENHMKPDHIAPSSKPTGDTWNYRWTDADRIVDAAIGAEMNVVGHTLIWHSQTPSWLTTGTREEVLGNLEKYVTDVADHFKGRLIVWDVVNEAMRDGLNTPSGNTWTQYLRGSEAGNGSRWNAVIGPEYIEKAFLAARAADPDAKLYYNDYNLNNANKARAVYNMVKDINGRHPDVGGRPLIDGIGMQSHHHLGTNPQTVEESIELFASLGVEVAISELDIIAAGKLLSGSPPWNEDAARSQAAQYAAMFRVFKKHTAKISRVTFWGLDDGTSWRTLDGSGAHAALLDKDYNLKPAFYAMVNPERY